MAAVCCTLYEGDHVHGTGALANSLYRAGFRGLLVIGYRGALPSWAERSACGTWHWSDGSGFRVVFWEVLPDIAVHQQKPYLMARILDDTELAATSVLFFDADALVIAAWRYFEALVASSVVLVKDYVFDLVSENHPWRAEWKSLCAEIGLPVSRVREEYYISAFCGVPRAYRELVDNWWRLTQGLHARRPDVKFAFKPGDRMTDAFQGTDQDLLSAALMTTNSPICTLGCESFGFTGVPCTMLHPTGEKPWRGSAISRLIKRGVAPDLYTRHYSHFLDEPIPVLSANRRLIQRLDVRCASALSRFYRTR